MTAKFCRLSLPMLVFVVGLSSAGSEEALDHSGQKYAGRLLKGKETWGFQTEQARAIGLNQLAYVRFDEKTAPLPRAPLIRTLVLPHGQRISGILLSVDKQKVVFVTSWGKTVTLGRARAVGIEQDALPIVHDDFESSLQSWRVQGKATLSQERPFFGKSSLLLDTPGQSVTRAWPAFTDGTIRLYFYDPASASNLRWTFEVLAQPAPEKSPGLVIGEAYASNNLKQPFGPRKRTAGWHLLSIETEGERLRLFVDDYCLGQTVVPAKETITGLRIAAAAQGAPTKEKGELWIDELVVARRLAPLPRPKAVKDQDLLWLEHGEQLFGQVVSADPNYVVFEAKFGKRSLAWSKVRGILFASTEGTPASADPEISFRPGPGFPIDCLRAKLVRWEDAKLIVDHDLFGAIPIERDRLDKIRFTAK